MKMDAAIYINWKVPEGIKGLMNLIGIQPSSEITVTGMSRRGNKIRNLFAKQMPTFIAEG